MTPTTTARCPVCGQDCKLVNGKLSRHGFRRTRGSAKIAGMSVSVCWGAKAAPEGAVAQATKIAIYYRESYTTLGVTEIVEKIDAFIAQIGG